MKLAALLFLAGVTAAHADCSLDKISDALAAPLGGMKLLEREASDIQSTEGGLWRIYREADGRVNTILRVDYGESGRSELRLSIVNRRTYGIASTRFDYFHHIAEETPNAVAQATTANYFFCDGALQLPKLDDARAKEATETRALFLGDKDVADFTKGLVR